MAPEVSSFCLLFRSSRLLLLLLGLLLLPLPPSLLLLLLFLEFRSPCLEFLGSLLPERGDGEREL